MCNYCEFHGGYSAEKSLMLHHYDKSEAIGAIGAGIQIDNDRTTSIATWVATPQCGYQYNFDINYCPMCGRKLSEVKQ